MSRGSDTGELITPLVPYSHSAGSHQQVMSPTLWRGRAIAPQQNRHPLLPERMVCRKFLQNVLGLTPTLAHTGGALGGIDPREPSGRSGAIPPASTTIRQNRLLD